MAYTAEGCIRWERVINRIYGWRPPDGRPHRRFCVRSGNRAHQGQTNFVANSRGPAAPALADLAHPARLSVGFPRQDRVLYSDPTPLINEEPMTPNEIARVQDYLRRTFTNERIAIDAPAKRNAPVEVRIGDEFIGVLHRDDEDG